MTAEEIFAGETGNIEYKVDIPPQSEKYVKTAVAFANGKGGKLIFGVENGTWKIIGFDRDEVFQKMDAITNAIFDSCEPKITPDIGVQEIEGKPVIVVDILPGMSKPYYIKSQGPLEGTYIRVSGTTRRAERYQVQQLILEGENKYYDSEPCNDIKASKADIKKLCGELKKIALKNTLSDTEKEKIKSVSENVLLSWGVLTEQEGIILPTNSYALLTGQAKEQPMIQCAVFKGKDRAYFVDRREMTGPIQDQMDDAVQYVLEKIDLGMKIKGSYRQDVYELPPDSVRELIANAVAHRCYLEPGNIQVSLFNDRLEVTSPGMLPNGVSIQKMKEGYSKPRNRAIANAFAYMRIIEKWGSGIPRIIRECKDYGLLEPEFIDFEGDLRVNMYRKSADGSDKETTQTTQTTQSATQTTQRDKLTFTQEDVAILNEIRKHSEYTQTELSTELGWTVDRVKYYLNKMKKQKIIKRAGSSHNGHWELLVKDSLWQN